MDLELIKNITTEVITVTGFGIISFISSMALVLLVNYIMKIFKTEKKEESINLSKKNRNKKFGDNKKTSEQRIKLSKSGICYIFGNYNMSPAVYSLIIRPLCGLLTAFLYFVLSSMSAGISLSLTFLCTLIFMFVVGDLGLHIVLIYAGKMTERQIEWDIYKALTNIHLRLSTGEYLEDCLTTTAMGSMHPRFREAMDELIKNMHDKSKTMTESIEILKSRFSSERMENFCKILEKFISTGPSDGLFADMNEEINLMVENSSKRTLENIRHRYGFASDYFSIILIIIICMVFNYNFSENETINRGITTLICRVMTLSGRW